MISKFLTEGDVILITKDHTVYTDVPYHMAYSNHKGNFKDMAHVEVDLGTEFYSYLRGKYVVTKTVLDGGGTGHGPHDIYPDSHHVFCIGEDGKFAIDFYQSGSFTAMIRDIEPVGRAELKWTISE